jgi:hypothetical protein
VEKGVTCKEKVAGSIHTMNGILYGNAYGILYMMDNMLSAVDNIHLGCINIISYIISYIIILSVAGKYY